MHEIVFETSLSDTDAISDLLIGLGALSVTVEDAQANRPDESPLFGEPGMPTAVQAWPTSKFMVLLDIQTAPAQFWVEFCGQDSRFADWPYEIREIGERDWVAETQRQFIIRTSGRALGGSALDRSAGTVYRPWNRDSTRSRHGIWNWQPCDHTALP